MSEVEAQGPIERYLAAIEGAAMASCDALSADVVVDATVPNWRFTLHGEAAARDEFGRWYSHPGCFEDLTRTPLPDGELIEFTLSWEEDGVPHSVHQAHVVENQGWPDRFRPGVVRGALAGRIAGRDGRSPGRCLTSAARWMICCRRPAVGRSGSRRIPSQGHASSG